MMIPSTWPCLHLPDIRWRGRSCPVYRLIHAISLWITCHLAFQILLSILGLSLFSRGSWFLWWGFVSIANQASYISHILLSLLNDQFSCAWLRGRWQSFLGPMVARSLCHILRDAKKKRQGSCTLNSLYLYLESSHHLPSGSSWCQYHDFSTCIIIFAVSYQSSIFQHTYR